MLGTDSWRRAVYPDAESGPVVRALLALESIQNSPGISARALGDRLGVTDRAARRTVATLRSAGIPVESAPGRYGGYRLGRSYRLPPLMFTAPEALGLIASVVASGVMAAAADGPGAAAREPVEAAVAKLLRALPSTVADGARLVREVNSAPDPELRLPDPAMTAQLVRAAADGATQRLTYWSHPESSRELSVDPLAVVVRHQRWYLLCHSRHHRARRVLRIDRIGAADATGETFVPPTDLDPLAELEHHFSVSWSYRVQVCFAEPVRRVRHWFPPSMGELTANTGPDRTCTLVGTTDDTRWYAGVLAESGLNFRVLGGPELQTAVRSAAGRLADALDL